MIIKENNVFNCCTQNTSYMFSISDYGHLEHIYYGRRVSLNDAKALSYKSTTMYGNTVVYDENNENYALNILPQECPGFGRGDYREPSLLIEHYGSTVLDLKYDSFEIVKEDVKMASLPDAYGADETLIITLMDKTAGIEVRLFYAIFYESDVITRRMEIINRSPRIIYLNKAMSYSIDFSYKNLVMMSFHGGWANEFHKTEKDIEKGKNVLESRCGFSSNTTNPGFIIRKKNTGEENGEAWGFNLIYSGNHYSSVSRNDKDNVRVMSGINPENFRWALNIDESFETPSAVLTYSDKGLNKLSQHFHIFINEHIVKGPYKKLPRPILINSWEGFGFDFDRTGILETAAIAKNLGMELLVLDDGWFGNRNDDRTGLGDYNVNTNKLANGLGSLIKDVHELGLRFGLWFEPEGVNPDSKLYRNHKDWAIENEYPTVYGRHELLLDLTRQDVQDYIVENVSRILDENSIDYVKWDMNRQLAGVSGEFSHRYIISLYHILERIFAHRGILLESCSSGGNRFDLGMLCYSPQIWASDNTDAIERISIQKNLSYLYPLSVISAHVNGAKGNQTLRQVPLATRFNVAAYGLLGYELNLRNLSKEEKDEIREQISFYKKHRQTFQFGTFFRIEEDETEKESFEVFDGNKALVAKYRKLMPSIPTFDRLKALHLDEEKLYCISERRNDKRIAEASAYALESGVLLDNLYLATEFNENVRMPNDFGSELYVIEDLKPFKLEDEEPKDDDAH